MNCPHCQKEIIFAIKPVYNSKCGHCKGELLKAYESHLHLKNRRVPFLLK